LISDLLAAIDPQRPVSLLQSGRSVKPNFREFEFYEAAVGSLTFPAIAQKDF